MNRALRILLLNVMIAGLFTGAYGQAKIVDQIVAIVGEYHILQSDIESMYLQNRAQGITSGDDMKCEIMEDFLAQKLLLNQAKIDSIEVPESNVEMQLDGRLQYFTSMIGSPEALEEYFNKSLLEIKEDMRESVREQLVTGEMQNNITTGITVTPSEIRDFYNSLPRDSVPFINSRIGINQLTMYPPVDEEAIFEVKQRLLDLRRRILDGEKFTTLAVLYSEGPSASQGGELGFLGRAELDAEYAKAAFSLKEGGVSTIVESSFGYHLIQLIERRDDRVNTRHIIMNPEVNPEANLITKNKLDSIAKLVRLDTVPFELAAMIYSQDKNTAVNGGLMVNPVDNTKQFEMDQLRPEEYVALRDLEVGDITDAFESKDESQKQVFKIIKIRDQSEPHRANIRDDYMILQEMTLVDKKMKVFQDWLDEKMIETYIHVDDSFAGCQFSRTGWIQD